MINISSQLDDVMEFRITERVVKEREEVWGRIRMSEQPVYARLYNFVNNAEVSNRLVFI